MCTSTYTSNTRNAHCCWWPRYILDQVQNCDAYQRGAMHVDCQCSQHSLTDPRWTDIPGGISNNVLGGQFECRFASNNFSFGPQFTTSANLCSARRNGMCILPRLLVINPVSVSSARPNGTCGGTTTVICNYSILLGLSTTCSRD